MRRPFNDQATRHLRAIQSRFICATVLMVSLAGIHSTCRAQAGPDSLFSTREAVGQTGTNRYYTPANQVLTPAGVQVELPGMRPQGIALSPNGRLLVTAGKTHDLVVLDPATGKILQRVPLPSGGNSGLEPDSVAAEILRPDKAGQLSFTGLIFSPDGSRIYLSNVDGNVKVFVVKKDGNVVGLFSIPLPPAKAPNRSAEIPAGMAVSPDGKRLYVALNLSNRLAELDVANGRVLRLWDVGVAPYDVALAGQKAYVSNWGGRRPFEQDVTGPAGLGTLVRVDPVRHIAAGGSVSVIDLRRAETTSEVRNRDRAARLRDGGVAQWPLGRGRQRGQRHAQRYRHPHRPDRRDHLCAAESGGLVRGAAQRARL